ncbi:cytochrome c oxidase subunit II [Polaromonas eurypsychrophila]|uniref:Cytochrome aa3 subunit 2 n=1 Tax=Polaromonas eurypsychrophila TaxID=1614635 RepID=A0A916SIY2_9BURK|nr:cytochrome c oxidase subunit II [Polaromonas eurypsychrophila]GGB02582.1 cytochrome c oxidase subunit II [Polaromonas eurypsychrophila]
MSSVLPPHIQSVLAPAGEAAARITSLSWLLIIGATLIFVFVMTLLVVALRGRERARPVSSRLWIIGGGVVFPLAVLSALLTWTLARTPGWLERPPPGALVVGITAHMWWWEVRYRDPASGQEVTLANELHLPSGRPVWLGLSSPDVIHSFWVPALGGKMDMVPGRVNHLMVQVDQAGKWRGQCAEYCGEQHARMAIHVVAHAPADFDAWLAAQALPAAVPIGALVERGRAVFLAQRCNACHTVRGVAEEGKLGPDLTHVGSRLYLGAGTLLNQSGAMAHWVAHTQELKPGARMPSSADMDTGTLQALAAYLEHLK